MPATKYWTTSSIFLNRKDVRSASAPESEYSPITPPNAARSSWRITLLKWRKRRATTSLLPNPQEQLHEHLLFSQTRSVRWPGPDHLGPDAGNSLEPRGPNAGTATGRRLSECATRRDLHESTRA